jgi:hypothetical protein
LGVYSILVHSAVSCNELHQLKPYIRQVLNTLEGKHDEKDEYNYVFTDDLQNRMNNWLIITTDYALITELLYACKKSGFCIKNCLQKIQKLVCSYVGAMIKFAMKFYSRYRIKSTREHLGM